jgi:hypothetical protein
MSLIDEALLSSTASSHLHLRRKCGCRCAVGSGEPHLLGKMQVKLRVFAGSYLKARLHCPVFNCVVYKLAKGVATSLAAHHQS